uniref:Uncharacterized protein n=1 Tax=Cucumis melo TaxID=3656 RepID=A0A9I9E8L4_CUCME
MGHQQSYATALNEYKTIKKEAVSSCIGKKQINLFSYLSKYHDGLETTHQCLNQGNWRKTRFFSKKICSFRTSSFPLVPKNSQNLVKLLFFVPHRFR